MRKSIKAAVFAFAGLGAGIGVLTAPASAQPYDPDDNGYDQSYGQPYDQPYGQPYSQYSEGYGPYDGAQDPYACDPNYDCPDDYYDLPLYYGDVFYDGSLFNGPFYYRDYGGRRQFWRNGGWHFGDFRGGHFGPALGRDYYRGRGFGGGNWNRGGNGQVYSRHAYQPQQNYQAQPYRGGRNWNGGSFRGQQAQSYQGQSYQGQSYSGGGNWNRGGSGQVYSRHAYQPQQSAPVQAYTGNHGGYAGRSSFQGSQQTPQAYSGPRGNEGGHGWNGGGQGGGQGGGWHHGR